MSRAISCNKLQTVQRTDRWYHRSPGEDTGYVAGLLDQGEGGHEADADAHQDGVGKLPAGALDYRGMVVLDEHAGGDDGND